MIEDPPFPLGIVPALADCRNDRFDGILYLGIRTLDHTRRFQRRSRAAVFELSCIRFFLSKEER
jgi:hypothetical protein